MPQADERAPILFGGDDAVRWTKGSYDVWVLRGRCYVQQGATAAEAQQAVLWVKRGLEFDHERVTVLAYLEGDVRIVDGRSDGAFEIRDRFWFQEFASTLPPEARTPPPREGEPPVPPQVFVNAQAYRDGLLQPIRPAQYAPSPATGAVGSSVSALPVNPIVPSAPSDRRLRAFSRSSVKVQVKWIPSPNGQEWVGLISPGVNLIIDGLEGAGTLDIAADRLVVWTSGREEPDLSGQKSQGGDKPLELYMEGNIVFREGARVIYADRMYYNVNAHAGTILNADVLSPLTPGYDALVRLKADVVRQTGEGLFEADRGSLTTSRMADPRYRIQSQHLTYRDELRPVVHPLTGQPLVDPVTGEPVVEQDRLATGSHNLIFAGPVPVFYWPVFAADLDNPQFYVRNVKVRNDQIFGTQVLTDLDMHQILGLRNKPRGTDWVGSADYLSNRGFGGGSTYRYSGAGLLGFSGDFAGLLDGWMIRDHGNDRLGSDRMDLVPEKKFRGRLFGRHRQQLPDNFQLTAELGWISDRNFLEQYFENEWDTFKDQANGLELKHLADNTSWALSADFHFNPFFTQTSQLPRFDHFWLGESLVGDTLTWYEHSSAEYAQLGVLTPPMNPSELAKFKLLPWEAVPGSYAIDPQGLPANVNGERLVTAQEIDLPLTLGPAKIVPYALGQAGHWGQDLSGNDTQRLFGQAGVRAALPFWSVNPGLQSELLNVNGIAHKVVFDVDASFAEANRDLAQFPLYDQIDDDGQEHFRRRFAFNTFGGTTPPQFDERFYALRAGLAGNVSNPSAEIADDLSAVRLGLRQRWQTKRGPVGRPRIVDWITLDTQAVWYPQANRDNFGEDFGLVLYDYRWHISERVTLLSDGGFDFFDRGQQTVSVGAQFNRPTNGTIYLGYRSLQGPFSSQIVIAQASYRMSPKWFGRAGMSYDFSGSGTIGNNFSLVRIGESFLMSVNFAYDAYKSNVTAMFNIEPRFIPALARNALNGLMLPAPGAYGLE